MKRTYKGKGERVIFGTMRAIDIWIAILILTGQITVGGVFVSSGAIWFSLIGPILGYHKIEGKSPNASVVLDGIDVITAFLLILGQLTHCGPWISSRHFNFVVSGPAFGNTAVPVPINPSKINKTANDFFGDFTHQILIRELNKLSNMTERP
ncbi:hypothetical protein [Alicyclobacillus fastidiosus]|uniref:Uncharacterized protein n=1 Tax=Alicyclobacillus fastidiosus TaxID=392011 RepID=A0ABV5AJX9_9BACL|nr:hypothetical protein [Alicyclobacillus fastidiosus]WEH09070.1 hypothetical protein PYS47_20690 [Alicyclobacillus fastidiosus]